MTGFIFLYFIVLFLLFFFVFFVYKSYYRILIVSILVVYNSSLVYLISNGEMMSGFRKLSFALLSKGEMAILGLQINFIIFLSLMIEKIIQMKVNFKFLKGYHLLYFTFAVGAMSLYWYSKELGGWNTLFSTVLSYRAGVEVVYTELAFLKTTSVLSSGLYPFLIDRYNFNRTRINLILWLLAFFIGFAAIFIQGGRLMLMLYLVPLGYFLFLKNRGLIVVMMLFIPVLINPNRELFGESLGVPGKSNDSVATVLFSEVIPPVSNMNAVIKEDFDYTYFRHVFTVYKAIVPKRLLGIGDYEGEQVMLKNIVGFPNAVDGMSFGYMSAGFFGGLFWILLFLKICRVISSHVDRIMSIGFKVTGIYILSFFMIRSMYFSPIHFVLSVLPIIPLLIVKLRRPDENLSCN